MIIFHKTMDIAVAKEDGWVAQRCVSPACIMPNEDKRVDYEIVAYLHYRLLPPCMLTRKGAVTYSMILLAYTVEGLLKMRIVEKSTDYAVYCQCATKNMNGVI